jgi:hypothetical protein
MRDPIHALRPRQRAAATFGVVLCAVAGVGAGLIGTGADLARDPDLVGIAMLSGAVFVFGTLLLYTSAGLEGVLVGVVLYVARIALVHLT